MVPTGEEAVRLVDTTPFSLMLVELDLSGIIDGKETARRIQARCDIPVIFMTTDAERSLLESVLGANSHACLLKPVGQEVLRMAMEDALGMKRAFSQVGRVAGSRVRQGVGNGSLSRSMRTAETGIVLEVVQEPEHVPCSLEALGYSLEGYWEERAHLESGNYLEARFDVAALCRTRTAANRPTVGGRECTRLGATEKVIDCTGLNEICRAADGTPYKVPRLRIRPVRNG